MRPNSMLMALVLGTMMGVSSAAGAADAQQGEQPPGDMSATGKLNTDRGIDGGNTGGMQGMKGMHGGGRPEMQGPRGMQGSGMQGCDMMSGGAMQSGMMRGGMMDMMKGGGQMRSGAMMPQLPPGNEKLQLQMQSEMMQKMGEILGKYADRIKD